MLAPPVRTKAIGTAPLLNGALGTAASNRRAWGDGWHHILNGTTGIPVRNVVATWAMAPLSGGRRRGHRIVRYRTGTVVIRAGVRMASGLFGRDSDVFPRIQERFVLMTHWKSRIDTALGKVTMYRFVLWVLSVLALYSILLDTLGWFTFGLWQMLAHLVLCVGLTYISGVWVAAAFRAHAQAESSLITGLLLYFLFWPSLTGLDIAGTALACVIASVSKYAIAYRGRHIFNPAAAGAFITSLTGLNVATWWAASPSMLWLTVPAVLLVLYRIRKTLMAAVFLAASTAISGFELLRTGMPAAAALWQLLAQRPLLFFAGFMLIEPLTLPPRRWQQLALAGAVGVAFAVPFNFRFAANSPELALLLGNLAAFAFGQRGGVRLKFTGSRPLTPDITEFRFKPTRTLRFSPGQFIELHLPHRNSDGKGRRRVFSITSGPDAEELTLGVQTTTPASAAKSVLLGLAHGDVVHATSIGGDFIPPRDPTTPVLLIAAGVGITPFLAHLSDTGAGNRDTTVLYLAQGNKHLAYVQALETSGARVIARLADASSPPSFMEDAGTERIDHHRLQNLIPDISSRHVYISGSPASVESLRSVSRKAGARRISVDSFAGY